MPRGEQIDKVSKMFVKLNQKDKKFAKKEHKRYLRRLGKNTSNPTPQHNRYRGFIG